MEIKEVNHIIKNPTLSNIGKTMEKIEDKGIKIGEIHRLHVGKSAEIDIVANPTKKQPGNAVLAVDGNTPSWENLRPALDKNFGSRVKQMEKKPLTTTSLQKKSVQAALLQKLEEARRTKKEKEFPSRNAVKRAGKRALQNNQASRIAEMYTGTPEKRKKICKELAGSSSSRPTTASVSRYVSKTNTPSDRHP